MPFKDVDYKMEKRRKKRKNDLYQIRDHNDAIKLKSHNNMLPDWIDAQTRQKLKNYNLKGKQPKNWVKYMTNFVCDESFGG